MDKKEARNILIGQLVRLDEHLWAAAPSDAKFHFHGIRDGAGDVYLFGVTHLTRCYQAKEIEPAAAFAMAADALYSMGRPILPKAAPAEKATLYAPTWIAPVLLSIEQHEAGFQLTAHTGHSLLFGKLRCHIAMWILEQRLPAEITRQGEHLPPKKAAGEKKSPKSKPAIEKTSERAATKTSQKKNAPKRLKKKAPPKRLQK